MGFYDETMNTVHEKMINYELQERFDAKSKDYETAKSSLIIRPINIDAAKPNSVYRIIGLDIALTLYMILKNENGTLNTVQVPKELIEHWNVNVNDVFDNALTNTETLQKPRYFNSIFDSCDDSRGKDIDDISSVKMDELTSIMITTNKKTNGAIAMFFPDTQKAIADGLNTSYYAVFTSIHECIIHPINCGINPASIVRNLQETNRIFGPADTLTNSVFLYDKDRNTFNPLIA